MEDNNNGSASGAQAAAAGGDGSAYDRLVERDLYKNVMRAGRRWINTVYSSATPQERAKGVHDLKHWCLHPLLPAQKRELDAEPHAFFTDRVTTDPSQKIFCDMALSMHSIAASEFGVERLFSLIHRIIGPHRSSLSNDGIVGLACLNAQVQEEAKRCACNCACLCAFSLIYSNFECDFVLFYFFFF
jgi:hypothetical protein